jgi:hypothetical protein
MEQQLSYWLHRLGGPRAIIAIVGGMIALLWISRWLSRPRQSKHLATTRCDGCGWTGTVSAYRPICPKCAKKLSQQ